MWSYCVIRIPFKVPEFLLYWVIFGYIISFIFFFRSIIFLWNTEKASNFIPSPLYTCQVSSSLRQELPASQPSKITPPFAELWIQGLADKGGGNDFQTLPFLNMVVSFKSGYVDWDSPSMQYAQNCLWPLNLFSLEHKMPFKVNEIIIGVVRGERCVTSCIVCKLHN